MKTAFKLLVLSFFLMAFQCDDEDELIYNNFKISVTPQATFSLQDTIWIEGKISSKIYNADTNDSIPYINPPIQEVFYVMKLIDSNLNANSEGALEQFGIINNLGESFPWRCDKSDLRIESVLNSQGDSYSFKIGFVPLQKADYVFSFTEGKLTNPERNENIAQDYLLSSRPDAIGFERCGEYSYRILNETDREFYFSVR
ncbi:hypothetical protein Aeqsu_2096 [Aequorivita sublithincola DSM 14238]|uniref:Uncharacterized protein n=1 Tax=Aequorivita sublithincola (strain DSM 14238 / LMG 21431 / ACAM 643 / 9-3) TaxID=746697 RepID=I3YX41_AEQSU|nr:hypothetical protein [Aequorivita sublithincola]AFL81559.1 hypothetical protein Aeqsu_2096 [Aequorivita sublithincola DSM 14238]